MLTIVNRQCWKIQPSYPRELNFYHPLARGIIIPAVPAWRTSEFSVTGNSVSVATVAGQAIAVDSANYISANATLSASANLSIGSLFIVFAITSAGSLNRAAGRFSSLGGAGNTYGYMLTPNASNYRALINDGTASYVVVGNSIVLNKIVYQTMTWGDGNLRFYDSNTIHTPVAGTCRTDAAGTFRIGNVDDFSMTAADNIVAVFLYNRILSYDEHLELVNNPWIFYKPIIKRTYLFLGGAGQVILPQTGHSNYVGSVPGFLQPNTILPATGHSLSAGFVPGITQGSGQTIAPNVGHSTFFGYVPGILHPNTIFPQIGHSINVGYVPAILQPRTILPQVGHSTEIGYIPAIQQGGDRTLHPQTGHSFSTGFTPVILHPNVIAPNFGHSISVGYIPGVQQGEGLFIAPLVGHSIATGYLSSIVQPNVISFPETGHEIGHGYTAVISQTVPYIELRAILNYGVRQFGDEITVQSVLSSEFGDYPGVSERFVTADILLPNTPATVFGKSAITLFNSTDMDSETVLIEIANQPGSKLITANGVEYRIVRIIEDDGIVRTVELR